jgi:hypothetical protein
VLLGFAVPISGSWATAENCVHVARRAEALGYTPLWTFQRLLSPLEGDAPVLAPQYRSVHDPLTNGERGAVTARSLRCRIPMRAISATTVRSVRS